MKNSIYCPRDIFTTVLYLTVWLFKYGTEQIDLGKQEEHEDLYTVVGLLFMQQVGFTIQTRVSCFCGPRKIAFLESSMSVLNTQC